MQIKLSIEKAATEFREKCGYNSSSPIRLKSLLIDLNVLSVFRNLDPQFSGMSVKVEEHKFMLVNSAHSIGRQHFTILHELYHLFVEEDFEHAVCKDELSNQSPHEALADQFAANVLLPKDGILKRIDEKELKKKDQISIAKVLELEQFFSCSHKCMLNRLIQLQIISERFIDSYSENIIELAKEYGHDLSLYKPGNEGLILGDYGTKVKQLFDRDLISTTHYLELMRLIGVDLEQDNFDANEPH